MIYGYWHMYLNILISCFNNFLSRRSLYDNNIQSLPNGTFAGMTALQTLWVDLTLNAKLTKIYSACWFFIQNSQIEIVISEFSIAKLFMLMFCKCRKQEKIIWSSE